MKNEWQKLNEYFRQHANVTVTHDPLDKNVIEDPRDSANIMSINLLMSTGTSAQKLKETAKKIQEILDRNNIAGVACPVEGAGNHTGINILAEQPLPKSLGIRSRFDGVPVGLSIVESLAAFKEKPASPKKSADFKP